MSVAVVPTRAEPGDGSRALHAVLKRQRSWLSPVAGVGLLLALWQVVAVTLAAGRHVVPTVPEFLRALVGDGFYLVHVRTTLVEAGQGFLWGNLAI
jgi:sulfonate transport system permease protein